MTSEASISDLLDVAACETTAAAAAAATTTTATATATAATKSAH